MINFQCVSIILHRLPMSSQPFVSLHSWWFVWQEGTPCNFAAHLHLQETKPPAMQATYSVTLDTTWKLGTCACGGRCRGDGGCWWRWATWLDKQLPFGHTDGLNWQNGGPGNELKGNLGEKLGGGNGGLLKIEKAAPWASVGHDGKPFALKDGGKFPKFGGGSCDISSVEK